MELKESNLKQGWKLGKYDWKEVMNIFQSSLEYKMGTPNLEGEGSRSEKLTSWENNSQPGKEGFRNEKLTSWENSSLTEECFIQAL